MDCEPQLTAVRYVPDCRTQCAHEDPDHLAECVTRCERPPFICGNAPKERRPMFKAVVITLAVIGFSATGALAIHQAVDR